MIKLKRDSEETVHATPVLLSRLSHYDSTAATSLFRELQFRLLVVKLEGDGWIVANPQKPTLLDPQAEPSYQQQIGRNTNYVIHPEEILADNFVHLIMSTADLPDSHIVDSMRRLLTHP